MTYEASRYHDFSAGHRVYQHESKCNHLHGHNYRVHFHCAAEQLDFLGRVIDFGDIKARLCNWLEDNWDHRTLIWMHDPWLDKLKELDPTVVAVPFNPTAEAMAEFLVTTIAPMQLDGTGIVLVRCTVEETRKCAATFYHS